MNINTFIGIVLGIVVLIALLGIAYVVNFNPEDHDTLTKGQILGDPPTKNAPSWNASKYEAFETEYNPDSSNYSGFSLTSNKGTIKDTIVMHSPRYYTVHFTGYILKSKFEVGYDSSDYMSVHIDSNDQLREIIIRGDTLKAVRALTKELIKYHKK